MIPDIHSPFLFTPGKRREKIIHEIPILLKSRTSIGDPRVLPGEFTNIKACISSAFFSLKNQYELLWKAPKEHRDHSPSLKCLSHSLLHQIFPSRNLSNFSMWWQSVCFLKHNYQLDVDLVGETK